MKRWGLVLIALSFWTASFAQFRFNNNSNGPANRSGDSNQGPQNKFYFGGGGGFGAGTGYNYYSLFPIAGYRITQQLSVGTGLNYQRYNYTYPANFSFKQYGVSPFMRYNFSSLFFQTELDLISAPAYNNANELVYALHSRLLFGLGYSIPVGRRGAINTLLMYDVLYRVPSVFNSPIVARVFFTF